MANDEQAQSKAPSSEGLAKDIARLYSYAHVGEGSYRVFTRHPKPLPSQPPVTEIPEPSVSASTPAPVAAQPTPAPVAAQATVQPTLPSLAKTAPLTQPASPVSVLKSPAPPSPSTLQSAQKTAIAIASIAGGVGKTTLAANLGRILSSHGENVLLADISGSGLLPFYFGAADLRPGLRNFVSPEPGSLPIHILGAEHATPDWVQETVKPTMRTAQRTIFDLGLASYALLPQILPLCAVILIPLVVDLNSIMSISRVEAGNVTLRERFNLDLPSPIYVLNKYDEESPREREGRELIARQINDRLLPITIRRSPYMTEAISQRMTVVDYAFDSKITEDLYQLATWIREAAPIAHPAVKPAVRWSEA